MHVHGKDLSQDYSALTKTEYSQQSVCWTVSKTSQQRTSHVYDSQSKLSVDAVDYSCIVLYCVHAQRVPLSCVDIAVYQWLEIRNDVTANVCQWIQSYNRTFSEVIACALNLLTTVFQPCYELTSTNVTACIQHGDAEFSYSFAVNQRRERRAAQTTNQHNITT